MFVYAVVLIKVKPGRTLKTIDEIKKMEHVGLVTAITGSHDLFALIRTDSSVALGQTIVRGLEDIEGVEDTVTHVVVSDVEPINWLKNL
ncbi:MAG: Lrp/AsnC ligand binding domain-containing protein [Aggregatilineales bacterium]